MIRKTKKHLSLYFGALSLVIASIIILPFLSSAASYEPVYRYYNGKDHFYTLGQQSIPGFTLEGPAFNAYRNQESGTIPIYRYFNKTLGVHFYTPTSGTYSGFGYEGIAFYAYGAPAADRVTVYRYFCSANGDHLYVPNTGTIPGYSYEGPTFYAAGTAPAPLPPPPTPPAPAPTPVPPSPKITTPRVNTGTTTPAPDLVAPVEDKEPPTVPAGLRGEFSSEDSSINLYWSPSGDNSQMGGYEIEKVEKGATEWQKIDSTEKEYYTDFNFESEKTYQYRVRAFDQLKNYSDYSNVIDVKAGGFIPNVTVGAGGSVMDDGNKVSIDFPVGSVSEDLFISIQKSDERNFEVATSAKIVGDVYEIKAKNSLGEEVTKFNAQIPIKMRYTSADAKGASASSIRIATVVDGKLEFIRSKLDTKNKEASTLTDHLSLYVLIADKSSAILTFLRVLLWILVFVGVGIGGYYGWVYYQKQKYQKEHRDDYIYKH